MELIIIIVVNFKPISLYPGFYSPSVLFPIQDIFVRIICSGTNKNATGTGHSGPKYPLWPLRAPPARRGERERRWRAAVIVPSSARSGTIRNG